MSFAYHKIGNFFFASYLTAIACNENWVRFAISTFSPSPPPPWESSLGRLGWPLGALRRLGDFVTADANCAKLVRAGISVETHILKNRPSSVQERHHQKMPPLTGLNGFVGPGNYKYVAPTELPANLFKMSKNDPEVIRGR